jgi:hypothetical protein
MEHGCQAAGTGHVADNDGRLARNMRRQVTRESAAVLVIAAAGRASDDDVHGLSDVEVISVSGMCGGKKCDGEYAGERSCDGVRE